MSDTLAFKSILLQLQNETKKSCEIIKNENLIENKASIQTLTGNFLDSFGKLWKVCSQILLSSTNPIKYLVF